MNFLRVEKSFMKYLEPKKGGFSRGTFHRYIKPQDLINESISLKTVMSIYCCLKQMKTHAIALNEPS